ncbi:cytotoxic T-lymphocyte protein 4 [Dicentrarchus labrax]|uniref:cytotoxic T-lymphocyte protein 4 n=1 Tax=Dicentrarchus labrax TaxID=13489 RepID=UPI0021F54723|nr:cytotoxic T-lymphocyte protein 4 [Dicentrarchus labrax]
MLLTHCMMEWIVLAVLSLCLPVWSAVKVIQPYRVVTTNGTAQVKCFIKPQPSNHQNQLSEEDSMPYPYPGPEELRVTLLKGLHGTQKVCSSVLILKEQREIKEEIEGEFQCSAQESEDAVEVTVSGLKATDTDMYRCEIEVFYPPPYLRLTGNGTLIHVIDRGNASCPVQEAHRQIAQLGGEEEDDEGDENMAPVSVPVVILVILVIFVLIIIIYLQTFQCERVKREIVRTMPGVIHKVDAAAYSCENIP